MATTSLGDLFVNIVANNDDYNKGIDASKKKTDTLTTSIKKLIGAGVLIALAKKVADVGAAAISAASDAEETQNKFDVVFSSMSDAANDMATELADAYGLSIQGAKDMLAGTGDLLTGLGFTQESAFDLSEQVLTLGADLASFTNYSGGAEGASEALTKALLGERESLKGLGISINETDLKAEVLRQTNAGLTFETDKQANAAATLTLVMNQSKNAMGDFERSQDSFANKTKVATARTKDLQVELGRALLPAASKGVGIFSDLTGKLGDYLKGLNDIRVAEEAQSSGNATREQELLILKEKLKTEQSNLKNQKLSMKATDERLAQAGIIQTQEEKNNSLLGQSIAKREGVITSISYAIDALETEIDTVNNLAKAEKEKADKKAEQDAKDEQAATDKKRANEDILKSIEDINTASKTDVEIIDEQIAQIQKLTDVDEESLKAQKDAIKNLQDEKQAILDEEVKAEQQANLDIETANEERIEKIKAIEKEAADEKEQESKDEVARLKAQGESIVSYAQQAANSIMSIYNAQTDFKISELERLSAIEVEALEASTEQETALSEYKALLTSQELERSIAETEKEIADLKAVGDEDSLQEAAALQRDLNSEAEVRRLDELAVKSREERAADIEDIEKELAQKKYDIELAQFIANKASAAIQATVNTAVAVTELLGTPPLAIAAGVAGAAEVAAIIAAPAPTAPAFAYGGVATAATTAVVGEAGGEVMLGMGAKGAPLIDELASRIASKSGGGQPIIINQNNMLNLQDQAGLTRVANLLVEPLEQAKKRRGL